MRVYLLLTAYQIVNALLNLVFETSIVKPVRQRYESVEPIL